VGNGALLVFAYTFRIFEDSDLEVTIQDTSVTPQTEITLVLNVDYTVSGAGNPTGGNVTLVLGGQLSAAPTATDNITIRREIPLTQEIDYVENDDFPAESHEEGLDRGTMVDQQIQEEVDRSLKIPANITGIDVTLPEPEAGRPIGWNDTGTGLVNDPDLVYQLQVDAASTPLYMGATSVDGVLRTDATIAKTDGGDFVTLSAVPGSIDHDSLLNFVADEHVAHSSVILTAGTGLSGTGDITASRTFDVTADYAIITANDGATDVTSVELETLTDGSNADTLHTHASITDDRVKVDAAATRDYIGATAADGVIRADASIAVADGGDFITLSVSEANVDHDALNNFVADEHVAHTGVTLTAGTGLSGGGDISANRTFDVDADYAVITANDGATDVTAAELEELTDGSTTALHTHAGVGTDEAVAVDAAATPGFLGAAAGDGVLRTSTPLSYTDGGDFVTITLDSTADFDSTGTWQFGRVEIDADTCYIDRDGSNNMTFTDAVTGTKTLAELAAGGGGGASLEEIVAQGGHGFVVGDWIRVSGSGTYSKAIADNSTNAESLGVVSAVADVNNFTVTFGGKKAIFSGLTPGASYFLSDTVAGTITDTQTTTEGSIVKPVLIAETATEGFIFNMRGNSVVSATKSFYQSFDSGDLVAGVLTLNHGLGHKFAIVQVYDDNDDIIYPDNINLVDDDNLDIDLSSFTVSNTWRAVVLDQGTTVSAATSAVTYPILTGAGLSVAVNHGLSTLYPMVQVYDDSGDLINPDDITSVDANNITIDLTSYGARGGTYNAIILSNGAVTLSTANDLNISGQTQGDILFFDGSNWTRLPAGTAGQRLESQGAGSDPTWEDEQSNLTGIVTSTGLATSIADKAIPIAKLADGVDGELITWDAAGVVDTVTPGTSGQILTSNGAGAAPTFQDAAGGGGLSNAIFSWSGTDLHQSGGGTYHGRYVGDNLTPNLTSDPTSYCFIATFAQPWRALLRFKFKKSSDVTAAVVYARLWSNNVSGDCQLRVNIGGVVSSTVTSNSTSPVWGSPSSSMNLSGLSDGTIYDGTVEIQNSTGSYFAYCSNVQVIAS
jgi:hypothetical protein